MTLEELKGHSCILITSKEQQNVEREFYQNTLGFGGSFLFAGILHGMLAGQK